MSRENLEAVQRAITALNDRDVDAYLAVCTPDVELVSPLAAIEGTLTGQAGIREFFSGDRGGGTTFRREVEELRPVGTNRVLALVRLAFESTGGVSLTQPIGNVYDLIGGQIRRVRVYVDRAEAL
jgi:ketosteroid isomerase-like protein